MKPNSRSPFQPFTRGVLHASLILLASGLSASAATFTWDGGGADAVTTTAANWAGDIAPGSNQDLQFGAAGTSGSTLTYASGNLNSMTFNPGASAYTIGVTAGQMQFISGTSNAIVNNSSNTQTFTAKVDVFFSGTKTFAANTAALSFANVGFRNDSMTAGQTNTLLFSGASNSTISGALSQTGAFTQLPTGFSNALTKSGTGTLTLTGTSTFTGLINVNSGTLTFSRATVGLTGANALTFGGTGTFNLANTATTAAAQALNLGALTFAAGEGSVRTTALATVAQDQKITFASLSPRTAGATGNFVNTLVNSTTNGFTFTTAPTASQIIDAGLFYNGSAYAAYDTNGFVRGLIYGTDTNATTATGPQSALTLSATTDAQYIGTAKATTTSGVATSGATSSLPVTDATLFTVGQAITGTNIIANTWITAINTTTNTLTLSQAVTAAAPVAAGTTLTPYELVTAQTGGTLNTVNLSGPGASMTLSTGETLALGGILRSGGNTGATGVITGGTALTAALAGGDLVVRTDLAADTLVVNTPVTNNTSASSFTKTGAGFVNLLNTGTNYTGPTRVNGGTLRFNKTTTASAAITPTSSISVSPGATLQLFVASSSTNTLSAPLTLSGNGVATSYSLEIPNGNTQTNTFTGGITLAGGAIIRTFGLANTYNFNTAAIRGEALGSGLTFRSEGGNSAGQSHTYNINVAATYTGNTTLNAVSQNGILKLGVATNALPAGTSLQLTGGASVNTSATLDLSARNQTLAGLTATPSTGGAKVINTSATLSTLTINNPAAVTFSGVLGGTAANANNFALTKNNAGTFTLSGTNTYTGATTINRGILRISNASSLGSTAGATTIAAGGSLDLNGAANVSENITLSGTGSSSVGALINNSVTPASISTGVVSISGVPATGFGSGYSTPPAVVISGTGTGANATASLGLTDASITAITLGGTGYAIDDLVNITGGGGTGAIAKVTAVDGVGAITAVSITNAGSGYTTAPTGMTKNTSALGSTAPAMTLTGNATNFTVGSLSITATGSGYSGTPTITVGEVAQTATLTLNSVTLAGNGSISGTGDITINPVISGAFDLTKTGVNTATLSGINTYTGATTVLDGTLSLVSPALSDSAALTIGAAESSLAVLNLPSAGTDIVGSLIIDGVTQPNGLYDSTNSGGAITGPGKIQVGTGGDAYTTWIEGFTPNDLLPDAASKLASADPDNDGIVNLLEFVLGGSPVASSTAILPTLSSDGSNLVLSYKRSDESESTTTQIGQWSTDLTTWNPITPVLVNENAAQPDDMTVSTPTSNAVDGKLFLRVNVVTP